jgi:hypothetical protein
LRQRATARKVVLAVSRYEADPCSMRGEPLIDLELGPRLSPMKHAHKPRMPALLLPGKDDERCPSVNPRSFSSL